MSNHDLPTSGDSDCCYVIREIRIVFLNHLKKKICEVVGKVAEKLETNALKNLLSRSSFQAPADGPKNRT